ncbi:MAG: hypothetical protein WC052_05335 [Patescibacteria group bacterium]
MQKNESNLIDGEITSSSIQDVVAEVDKAAEKAMKSLEKKGYKRLLNQVGNEYQVAWSFMEPKRAKNLRRFKLYNNQKRDDDAVGDPLLFTTMQTVLAALYDDQLSVQFDGRNDNDGEKAENWNSVAAFDYDEMDKAVLDYGWDFDTLFFGRGLVLLHDFDRKRLAPVPELIDASTWMRDPDATSVNGDTRYRGAMRFGGRPIRMSKQQMKDAGYYFNIDDVKGSGDTKSVGAQVQQARNDAQGLESTTMASQQASLGSNQSYELIEWFTYHNGKRVFVTLANDRTLVVRYKELTTPYWPIDDRTLFPNPHDWDGVSIPDLVEDKQRKRAVLLNIAIKAAEAKLYPGYLYDKTKIKNKNDLNFGLNKYVEVDGPVGGAVEPLVKPSPIDQGSKVIFDIIDEAAQKSTGATAMRQGIVNDGQRTATEIAEAARGGDARYSLAAKIFGWSEKQFWKMVYQLYKTHFTAIDEKMIRIIGPNGPKWQKFTADDLLFDEDPDITIVSKSLSETKRFQELRGFSEFLKIAAQEPTFNRRYAARKGGELVGLSSEELDQLLPPTVDEMIAAQENEFLSEGKSVKVNAIDNDMEHIEIHRKAKNNDATRAHIETHKAALIYKRSNPQLMAQLVAARQQQMMLQNPGAPAADGSAPNFPNPSSPQPAIV